MENIKDIGARKELVEKIKSNGLKEIHIRAIQLKEKIDGLVVTNQADKETLFLIAEELVAMLYLEEYLKKESMFQYTTMVKGNFNYIIPIETLEIWLEAGVLDKYLTYIEVSGIRPEPLNDRFFGYTTSFVTVFEKMVHKDKKGGVK